MIHTSDTFAVLFGERSKQGGGKVRSNSVERLDLAPARSIINLKFSCESPIMRSYSFLLQVSQGGHKGICVFAH